MFDPAAAATCAGVQIKTRKPVIKAMGVQWRAAARTDQCFWFLSGNGNLGYPNTLMVLSLGNNHYIAEDYATLHAMKDSRVASRSDGNQKSARCDVLCTTGDQMAAMQRAAVGSQIDVGGGNVMKRDLNGVLDKMAQFVQVPANLKTYFEICRPGSAAVRDAYDSIVHYWFNYLDLAGITIHFPWREHTSVDMFLCWPGQNEYIATQVKRITYNPASNSSYGFRVQAGHSVANEHQSPYSSSDFKLLLLLHTWIANGAVHPANGGLPANTDDLFLIPMRVLVAERVVKVVGGRGRNSFTDGPMRGRGRRMGRGRGRHGDRCYTQHRLQKHMKVYDNKIRTHIGIAKRAIGVTRNPYRYLNAPPGQTFSDGVLQAVFDGVIFQYNDAALGGIPPGAAPALALRGQYPDYDWLRREFLSVFPITGNQGLAARMQAHVNTRHPGQ
jgi:hypothetical protein